MDSFDVHALLYEIKLRYPLLGFFKAPKDDVMTAKAKPSSRPLSSVHLLSMQDPRTVARREGDVLSVPGVLNNWRWQVAAELVVALDGRPDHSVDYLCDWLIRFLDDVSQDTLDRMSVDLLKLCQQLREVTGEPKSKPVATCQCGTDLFYNEGDPFILCNGCGTIVDTYRLVEQLATKSGQTLVTRATLAQWTGRSEHTIRARCKVVDYDINGKALYDANEAQDVLDSCPKRLTT